MEVILLETIKSLGKEGQIIKVADGHARNFLLPKGKALEATPGNIALWEKKKSQMLTKSLKQKTEVNDLAKRLEEEVCVIKHKVGVNNKLYGSVTASDVAACFAARGIDIDRKKIEFTEQIKTLGDFIVLVRLSPEIVANVKVQVIKTE